MIRRPHVLLALVTCALAVVARAHDPYETFINAVLTPERLQIDITMAQANALRLIDPEAKIRGLTPENFPQYRARLAQEGATYFVLTAGRKDLAAPRVEVELTDELDVAYRLLYPPPPPGRLHIHAGMLERLGQGYAAILDVSDKAGHHLGWDMLTNTSANLEVVVPPPGSPAPKSK